MKPGRRMNGPRRVAVSALVALLAVGCDGGTTDPGDDYPVLRHDPILFVHGFGGSSDDFDEMRSRFEADGWRDGIELFAFDYSSTVSNAANAQTVRNHVKYVLEKTGAAKVDIISHEMGSLSSRFFIRHFDGVNKVDAWVSLGGPNHGTTTALGCTEIPCQEMSVESTFLTALNADVEGPPPARYATWRSPCDERVMPRESPAVWDAANFLTACLTNGDIVRDPGVYQQVKAFVE
jgi:triacylglycerol lipase